MLLNLWLSRSSRSQGIEMLSRVGVALFSVLLFSSCSKASIDRIFRSLPDRYQLTAAERQSVQSGLGAFLRLGESATLELKAVESPTIVSVCGIADGKSLFVGNLHRTEEGPKFAVKHVVNITSTTTYEIEVDDFCRL
jgi:hypothetical protein